MNEVRTESAQARRLALRLLSLIGTGTWAGLLQAQAQPLPRTILWPREVPLIGAAPLSRDTLMRNHVVLGFSSATCGYCVRHDAHLQKLHMRATPGVLVLGVATDSTDEEALRPAQSHGWTFPWTRAHQPLGELFDRRRILPRTYLVARGGELIRAIPGEMFESDVLELADIAIRRG
jgi:hypothetical protein